MPSGNLVQELRHAGMFIFPHKIYVDPRRQRVGGRSAQPNERERKQYPQETGGKGHTVVKFSPEGKVLMTIGKPGVAGNPPDALNEPTSIVVAPNGDIFITEGHSGIRRPRRIPSRGFRSSRGTASSSGRSASSARARANS